MLALRAIVVGFLVSTVGCLFYWHYYNMLFILINLATFYDIIYLFKTGINSMVVLILFMFMVSINGRLYYLNYYDQSSVISIIIITQLSDIYQYIVGYFIGRNKIGTISKNKTYEGYLGGIVLTYLTFIWFYKSIDILVIYALGIIGGLLSSFFKRKLGIKDYSNLLGPHGGWIDRTDSIILPSIFFTFIISRLNYIQFLITLL